MTMAHLKAVACCMLALMVASYDLLIQTMSGEEEDFEVLDVRGSNRNWLQKVLGDISRESVMRQAGVGAATGVLSGYMFVKIGKFAAGTIGTTVLLIQVAKHKGYISINWDKFHKDTQKMKRKIKSAADTNMPGALDDLVQFVQQNLCLAISFGGGFLIGMAL